MATDDMDRLDAADFKRVFAVNVLDIFQMTHRVAGAFGDGAIVNISSDSGMNGLGSSLAYAASKGALTTFTKGLARTVARARVNAVCPGYVAGRGSGFRTKPTSASGQVRGDAPDRAHAVGGRCGGDRAVVPHRRPRRDRSTARGRFRRAHGGPNRAGRRLTACGATNWSP